MWKTYILQSEVKLSYYIGSTGNLQDRMKRHNQNRCKATKERGPWKLIYTKEFQTKSEAMKFEYYIKKQKSRKFIENLINAGR